MPNYQNYNKEMLISEKRFPLEELNKYANEPSQLEFSRDGVQIFEAFLDNNTLKLLNSELDDLLSRVSFNKNIAASARLAPHKSELTQPISLSSINLLELSIDIYKILKSKDVGGNLILTSVEVFSELNYGKYLPFHTDKRRGMLRAQIYLKGGNKSSGGFKYIAGTHKINHTVFGHLSRTEVKECEQFIYDLSGNAGDLILFDPYGFHGKDICVDERRTIFLEFQKKDSPAAKASLKIDNLKLTPKVIDNLSLFLPGESSAYGRRGLDTMVDNYIKPNMVLNVAKQYFSSILTRIEKKIKTVFRL